MASTVRHTKLLADSMTERGITRFGLLNTKVSAAYARIGKRDVCVSFSGLLLTSLLCISISCTDCTGQYPRDPC